MPPEDLTICRGVSLEGRKFHYWQTVAVRRERGLLIETLESMREGLVLKFDPISLQNLVQWRDRAGLRWEDMLRLQKKHSIVFELCPVDDPLWTEEACSSWGSKEALYEWHPVWTAQTLPDVSVKRKSSVLAEAATRRILEEEEIEEAEEEIVEAEDPPPQRQRRAKEPPQEFLCPITLQVMRDPVVCPDGFTYEKSAVLEWKAATVLRGEPFRSPATGLLMAADMRPNLTLKALISSSDFAP